MDYQTLGGGPDKRVPPNRWNGLSNVIRRTRQADPSEGQIGGARLSCPSNRNGLSNVGRRTRQAGPSERWNRRGTLVVPVESEWIIKRWAADLTSRSLRIWRGVLVTPVKMGWIIKRNGADLTSRSLGRARTQICTPGDGLGYATAGGVYPYRRSPHSISGENASSRFRQEWVI